MCYEDILADPEAACKRLLEVCRIPPRHFPAAMAAYQTDSQNGTFGKRGGNKYKMLTRKGFLDVMYRVGQLDLPPLIEVFCILFHRSLPNFTLVSLKQHLEYSNFRCRILLDRPVG